MIFYATIVAIYFSFQFDFFFWPVPSEASTWSLINSKKKISLTQRTALSSVFVVNLILYTLPLVLAVLALINSVPITDFLVALTGIAIAIIGRIVTIKGALLLRNNRNNELVRNSLFKFSRNPISLGMHLTILGMAIFFVEWFLWLGLVFYFINIHYKIKIEENHLRLKFGESYTNYFVSTPRYFII